MADSELDARLDTVKKGYDPQQVRQLVAMLSNELKSLDAENTQLRQQLDLAKLNTTITTSRATDDIISSWTRETNEMLEGARQHVSRIMDKANADGAAVIAQADSEAAATRQRALAEAGQILATARNEAAALVGDGEQRGAAAMQLAELQSAELLQSAERRATEAATESRTSGASHQANIDQLTAEAQRLRDQITELEHERQSIRDQFVNTQVYIQGLVTLIEPSPTSTPERS